MKTKMKKRALPAWRGTLLEVLRYLFFAGYVILLVSALYAAHSFFASGTPSHASGEKG